MGQALSTVMFCCACLFICRIICAGDTDINTNIFGLLSIIFTYKTFFLKGRISEKKQQHIPQLFSAIWKPSRRVDGARGYCVEENLSISP